MKWLLLVLYVNSQDARKLGCAQWKIRKQSDLMVRFAHGKKYRMPIGELRAAKADEVKICHVRRFCCESMITMPRHLVSIYLMLVMWLSVIADEFHSPNHCSDCEETQNFSSNDTDSSNVLPVDVSNSAEEGLGGDARGHRVGTRHDRSRVLNCLGDRLEV